MRRGVTCSDVFVRRRVFGFKTFVCLSEPLTSYISAAARSCRNALHPSTPIKVVFAVGDADVSGLVYERYVVDAVCKVPLITREDSKRIAREFAAALSALDNTMTLALAPTDTSTDTPRRRTVRIMLYSNSDAAHNAAAKRRWKRIPPAETAPLTECIIHPVASIRDAQFDAEVFCEEAIKDKESAR